MRLRIRKNRPNLPNYKVYKTEPIQYELADDEPFSFKAKQQLMNCPSQHSSWKHNTPNSTQHDIGLTQWNHSSTNTHPQMVSLKINFQRIGNKNIQQPKQPESSKTIDFQRLLRRGKGSKVVRIDPEEMQYPHHKIEFETASSRTRGPKKSSKQTVLRTSGSAAVKAPFKHNKPLLMRQTRFETQHTEPHFLSTREEMSEQEWDRKYLPSLTRLHSSTPKNKFIIFKKKPSLADSLLMQSCDYCNQMSHIDDLIRSENISVLRQNSSIHK